MREPDWTGALDEAYAHALAHLKGLPGRPVGASTTLADLRKALGVPLPEGPTQAREVIATLAEVGRARPGGHRQRPVLRLRLRRLDPRRAGRGLAHLHLGPERGSVRDQPRGRGRRGGRRRLAARPARPAGLGARSASSPAPRWRTSPAWPPPGTRCCAAPAGTSSGAGCPAPRRSGCSPAPTARHHRPRAAVPRHRHRRDARRRGRRPGPDDAPTGCAAALDGAAGAGDRLHRRSATSTPAPSTRWARSATWRTRPAPGCTWTARSACGPRPARHCARWWPASTAPTRGPPTRTSGSTSRTTRGSSSAPTRPPTARRWASGRPT